MTLRILLVDDHPLFRTGMRAVLDSTEDLTVVAETDSAEEAVRLAGQMHPDLVVMDLHLPDGCGVDAITAIIRDGATARILVMTMSEEDSSILAAMRAGASGYLIKGASRDEVLQAVRTVAAGGAVFSAPVAARLTRLSAAPPARAGAPAFPLLTTREREILDMVARGYENRRIARELVLADKTVRNHITNLFAKLQVTTRAQAIVKAREAGLG
jgi:DNA-binding NarL/FixJ family response regulator